MKKLLMGNEAFAHAALEAGVRVVAGYPGTPSSELVETVARLRAEGSARGVHVEWSTNEKAALEVAAGASLAGARALFTCKQVGLNVASDALMSLNYLGVKGGLVLFVADDPGPISSQTEQDTRRFAAFAKVPVLDPATPEQGFAMMKAAFELSERYGTPVIVRPTTRICHASTFFEVADVTEPRPLPEEGFRKDPRWVIFPRRAWQGHGEINDRLRDIAQDFAQNKMFAAFNPLNVFQDGEDPVGTGPCPVRPGEGDSQSKAVPQDAKTPVGTGPCPVRSGGGEPLPAPARRSNAPRIGILAGGVSAAYVHEALQIVAEEAAAAGATVPAYRLWQVGTPYPFPELLAARFAEGLDAVIVFEELDHTLEDEMLRLAGRTHAAFEVLGKLTGDALDRGENSVEGIAVRLARFFDRHAGDSDSAASNAASSDPAALPVLAPLVEARFAACAAQGERYGGTLPVRPPVLCAGCPHRGSFYAIKRALGGNQAVLCGDIGCYTLGNAKPLDAVDTCLCMGAGITMAQGLSVVEPQKKQLAFVGDSTFFASGLTGIVNAVYNGHDVTVCVLDNATTAMTGSQPHPGTGVTLMGERRKPIDIEGMLRAMGVEHIGIADPLNLEESIRVASAAVAVAGPSAIIFRSPCIQLVKPAPAARIRTDLCTGCKKCITEIGCPGIGFAPDAAGERSKNRGQAFVDASLCNGCALCEQICLFDAIELPERNPETTAEPAETRPRPVHSGGNDSQPKPALQKGEDPVGTGLCPVRSGEETSHPEEQHGQEKGATRD